MEMMHVLMSFSRFLIFDFNARPPTKGVWISLFLQIMSKAPDNSMKHMVLGLPAEGPKAGSMEAEALHSAEAFLNDVRVEIEEYDRENARALEEKISRWSFWKSSSSSSNITASAAASASTAAAAMDSKSGTIVQRSSEFNKAHPHDFRFDGMTKAQRLRAFMRRKRNIDRVPLLQRRWVPWVCMGALALVWTPDTWKLRGLHYADSKYAAVRRWVHTEYWRATMKPDDFATLMKEIDAARPRSVKSTDCPF